MYFPTSPERSTSTKLLPFTIPSARKMRATMRATVVLPVPGLPVNTMCSERGAAGSPCARRAASTFSLLTIFRISAFTPSRPTSASRSSSAFLSSASASYGGSGVFGAFVDCTAAGLPSSAFSPSPSFSESSFTVRASAITPIITIGPNSRSSHPPDKSSACSTNLSTAVGTARIIAHAMALISFPSPNAIPNATRMATCVRQPMAMSTFQPCEGFVVFSSVVLMRDPRGFSRLRCRLHVLYQI